MLNYDLFIPPKCVRWKSNKGNKLLHTGIITRATDESIIVNVDVDPSKDLCTPGLEHIIIDKESVADMGMEIIDESLRQLPTILN